MATGTDLKLTLKQCSQYNIVKLNKIKKKMQLQKNNNAQTEETTLRWDEKKMTSAVDSLPEILIWLVWSFIMFLIPWTYAYQSNVFYHGHNSMLI